MGKVLTSESNYEDIADAIRDRSNSQATFLPGEMGNAIREMEFYVNNGTKQQLVSASGIISHDTFIELTQGSLNGSGMTAGMTTPYSLQRGPSSSKTNICRVSDNKGLVLYSDGSNNAMLTIVTIEDGVITNKTTPVRLEPSKGQSSNPFPSIVEIPTTGDTKKYLAVYHYYSNQLAGVVITVASDSTMTIGTSTIISSTSGAQSGASIAPVVLDDSTFIAYYIISSSLYAVPCTISGTTITAGTATLVTDTEYANSGNSPYIWTCASGQSAVVAYRASTNTTGVNRAIAMTVSNQSISIGTSIEIPTGSSNATYGLSIVDIGNGKVVASSHTNTNANYFAVLSVSGTTITALSGAATVAISNCNYYGPGFFPIKRGDGEFLLFYTSSNGSRGTCALISVSVSNTFSITYQSTTPGSGTNQFLTGSGVAMLNDGMAIFSSSKTEDYYTTVYLNTLLGPSAAQPSQTKIDGITADTITPSISGDVWVLDTNS